MPSQVNGTADTIRILVATDNHVGYNERDQIRGDDSWKTFDEIMSLAKEHDVDMVLLGGDLFHDNVPSRKSLYNVMRSLRQNCYGDKPCELQLLSDGTEHFDANIGHANYEDTNINVAIPVFSIHGNHDDPSGNGHFAALDILEMSGLLNYFGRVPQSDHIAVKPLLLQKGNTKLAVYGVSNVRDDRMYQTFKSGKVDFLQPTVQPDDWYNIGVVHQNHHAYTATSYLPENYLPELLDLVIWGHEHECIIEPRLNSEMGFKVMQPGSSVATSLALGEAVPKHVAILSITGRDMRSEAIPLKTVRPLLYRDIILAEEKEAVSIAKKPNYKSKLTAWLETKVNGMIAEANQQWHEAQATNTNSDPSSSPPEPPLPLIRLRVEHSLPAGLVGKFEVENAQRFGGRFADRVANPHDLVQFHIKKRAAAASKLKATEEMKRLMARPEDSDNVKVARLVQEFLSAQSLTILPSNCFGDAVNQYIDKDDKHAMDLFINDSLVKQIRNLVSMNEDAQEPDDEEDLTILFDDYKQQMEELFSRGQLRNRKGNKLKFKPKPDGWDSDIDGSWEDQPGAIIMDNARSDNEEMESDDNTPKQTASTRATRGRGRGTKAGAASTRGRAATTSTRKTTSTAASGASTTSRATTRSGKKNVVSESEEDDDEDADIIMLDSDEDDGVASAAALSDVDSDSQAMFFPSSSKSKPKTAVKPAAAPAKTGTKLSTTASSARTSRAASVASSTTAKKSAPAPRTTRKTPARTAAASASKTTRQSQLSFSTSQASILGSVEGRGRDQVKAELSEIEDDSDDDAFEVATTAVKRKR